LLTAMDHEGKPVHGRRQPLPTTTDGYVNGRPRPHPIMSTEGASDAQHTTAHERQPAPTNGHRRRQRPQHHGQATTTTNTAMTATKTNTTMTNVATNDAADNDHDTSPNDNTITIPWQTTPAAQERQHHNGHRP
jgi:hypothetical protein